MTRFRFDAAATFLIAALAFVLSYSQLTDLAARGVYGPRMAYVWPLAVDGLAVVATAAVMRLRDRRGYAWFLLVSATAVSVAAGAAAHLLPAGPLPPAAGAFVAIIPPLCVPLALHLAVQLRRDATDATTAQDAVAVTETERDVDTMAATDDDAAPIDGRDTDASTLTLVAAPEPPARANADQERHTATPDDAATGALFDVDDPSIDAPPESRDEKLSLARNLLATTRMSQREIARRVGLSKDAVNRIVGPGGRDALVASIHRGVSGTMAG